MKTIPLKFIKDNETIIGADSGDDREESTALLTRMAEERRAQLGQISVTGDPVRRAEILTDLGRILLRLKKTQEAWEAGHEAFHTYITAQGWQGATEACDLIFLSEKADCLPALGHALWLSVTYPVDAELTVAMLNHVVEETPPESDGAAVAAMTARYVVDLRATERQREQLEFYTNQLLATVARRHSAVGSQTEFDEWIKRLELDDPAKFLPRLRNVVDVLVQDDWWIDRETLQAALPS